MTAINHTYDQCIGAHCIAELECIVHAVAVPDGHYMGQMEYMVRVESIELYDMLERDYFPITDDQPLYALIEADFLKRNDADDILAAQEWAA